MGVKKVLCGVAASLVVSATAAIAKPVAHAKTLKSGIWQSDGYGYVIEINNEKVTSFYDVAGDLCMAASPDALKEVNYIMKTRTARLTADGKNMYLSEDLEPYEIGFRKVTDTPDACTSPVGNSPVENLEAFIAIFKSHYAFFDLYGVDWEAEAKAARKLVNANTTDAELLKIMSGMLAKVKDGHVEINAVIDGEEESFDAFKGKTNTAIEQAALRSGQDPDKARSKFQKGHWFDHVADTILKGKGKLGGKRYIQYGMATDKVAYLAFATEYGYANRKLMNEEKDLAVLNKTLDKAFKRFEKNGAEAVIIDISINFGGYDFISRAIASRFAENPTYVYSKLPMDAVNAEPFRYTLRPHNGKTFTGPVYLLTSDITVSAGELLAICLAALPNVTHVGEPTRGALSDVLSKTLPNGWEINLSNELYKDADGIEWEGRGVTPDIIVPVFDPENPAASHGAAIRKILSLINDPNQG